VLLSHGEIVMQARRIDFIGSGIEGLIESPEKSLASIVTVGEAGQQWSKRPEHVNVAGLECRFACYGQHAGSQQRIDRQGFVDGAEQDGQAIRGHARPELERALQKPHVQANPRLLQPELLCAKEQIAGSKRIDAAPSGLRGGHQARHSIATGRTEIRGAFEHVHCRSVSSAAQGALCGPFELGRNVFVRSKRGLGSMPGSPIGLFVVPGERISQSQVR
jgi:hypothetical protein